MPGLNEQAQNTCIILYYKNQKGFLNFGTMLLSVHRDRVPREVNKGCDRQASPQGRKKVTWKHSMQH